MNTPPSSPPESTGLDREVAGDLNAGLDDTIAGERDIPSVNRRRSGGANSAGQKAVGVAFALLAFVAIAWYYGPKLTARGKQAAAPPSKVELTPTQEVARAPEGKSPTEVLAEVEAEQLRKARAERPPPIVGPIPLADLNAPPPPGVTAPGSAGTTTREMNAEERRRKEAQELLDKRRRAPLLAFGDETRGNAKAKPATNAGANSDIPGSKKPMTIEEATEIAERIASGQRGAGSGGPIPGAGLRAGGLSGGGDGAGDGSGTGGARAAPQQATGELAAKLTPTSVALVQAAKLPDRDLLITQGTFIDCVLETVLDSTVPGFTRCVTTRNIYSNSGRVILLERGTKIIGQYQGGIKQGQARIFVLWTRAETPHGVIIELASPGTDPLGAAGLPGDVDSKFWPRFGGALLLSIVADAFDVVKAEAGANQISTANTQEASKDAAGIALENSINIPPVLYKNQGDKINVVIAQDLDFSSVYGLRLSDN